MKIVFFGSDDFALAHLQALTASKHQVVACLTVPDKPKGRGLQVSFSPVKTFALANHIPVLQPFNLNDELCINQLESLESDLFIVIAYGKLLPHQLLKIPRLFALNVHGSLLPQYRGAAPINWAIINGDKKTGITIIRLNESMDAGDIVAQEIFNIEDNETAVTLRSKMMSKGPAFLLLILDKIKNSNVSLKPQDKKAVTLAPKLTKELGHIDWKETASVIHNLVRGLVPWPGAFTYYKGKVLKILETQVIDQYPENFETGEVISIDKQGFLVKTGQKSLLIKTVHLQDSKPMNAASFVMGHKLLTGDRLG